jgi:hypothetical protein
MLKNDEIARIEDADSLAARLDSLERNQLDLRQALGVSDLDSVSSLHL